MCMLLTPALVGLGLTGSFVSTRAARADTIADNFNAPALDLNWGVFGGSNYAVSTGANGLTIRYSSTSPNPAGTDGGVFSTFEFDGNFTARVVEDISGMPVVNAPSVFVNGGPLASEQNASSFVGPFNSPGPTTQGSVFENGVYIGGQNYNLSSEANTILIQRVGDTIFELIAPSGSSNFTQIYSASGAIFLGPTNLDLGLFVQGTNSVSNASVVYRNLSVVYGAGPSLPSIVSGVTGGTASDPAALPGQSVDEITGAIGPAAPQDFFRFHWNGGAFNSVADLVGADPSSTYDFELLGGPGGRPFLTPPTISKARSFTATLRQAITPSEYPPRAARAPRITSISQPRSPGWSRNPRPGL